MNGELRRHLYVGIAGLVAVQILIAFGAIGLLSRMAPAVERIMAENVYSLEAAEDLMATLPMTGEEAPPEARRRFQNALGRLRGNITEEDEAPLVDEIEALAGAALAGDVDARARVSHALRRLNVINRQAMQRADDRAQRLGRAGAWSAVFVAALGFAASFVVVGRLRRRVVEPVIELYSVVESLERGERHRRCTLSDAPEEIRAVMLSLNRYIDRVSQRAAAGGAESRRDRAALLHLLDRLPQPTAIVDGEGALVAASESALERLQAEGGAELRAALREASSGGGGPGLSVTPMEGASLWLVGMDG